MAAKAVVLVEVQVEHHHQTSQQVLEAMVVMVMRILTAFLDLVVEAVVVVVVTLKELFAPTLERLVVDGDDLVEVLVDLAEMQFVAAAVLIMWY